MTKEELASLRSLAPRIATAVPEAARLLDTALFELEGTSPSSVPQEPVPAEVVAGKPAKHQAVYERDKFTCRYCGIDCRKDFDTWYHAMLGFDHVVPQSLGGTDEHSNLVTCCHACNVFKGKARVNSIDEAHAEVRRKRNEARAWFGKYVEPLREV